ncbi:POK8 protein, partial [Steatornis caripensis]|nr:POK8 protein [Steatornis caripensis]
NSPTLCRLYVDAALQPIRQRWSGCIIYHYIDDILFAQQGPFSKHQIQEIRQHLATHQLVVAEEKVQSSAPWRYLGWTISQKFVTPQKLQLKTQIKTVNDAQKLLGDLQWLQPVVGIPSELLSELRPLLRGSDPTLPVTVSPRQQEVLQQITDCVTQGKVQRRSWEHPLELTLWAESTYVLGAITQSQKKTGVVGVLEWISPGIQQTKTLLQKMEILANVIKKGRERILQVDATEPALIRVPMKKESFEWFLSNSEALQEALLGLACPILTDKLVDIPLAWMGKWQWIVIPKRQIQPIAGARTVFTDAGKKSHTAAITWEEEGQWQHQILKGLRTGSLQTLELLAVIWALATMNRPLNIVMDSAYVAGVVARIEGALIKEVQNQRLFSLFNQLLQAVNSREHEYAIIHIRSHKWDVGL